MLSPIVSSSDIDDNNDTQARTQSLIGIAVAIGGNVLISLALNCQKLAHKRLEIQKQKQSGIGSRGNSVDSREGSDDLSLADAEERGTPTDETRPLVLERERRDSYTIPSKSHSRPRSRPRLVIPRDAASPRRRSGLASSPLTAERESVDDLQAVAIEITGEENGRDALAKRGNVETIDEEDEDDDTQKGNESDYLRSKLWCVYSHARVAVMLMKGGAGGLVSCL
jgi:hypothetical protein